MRIHPDGWPYIAIAVLLNALLFAFAGWFGLVLVPVTLWCIAFFRDPQRTAPQGAGLIVSPADGVMLPVVNAAPPAELGMGAELRQRLSIFMNVFDVHVNRVPADGTVKALAYRHGRFFNASFDKASEHNERMAVRLSLVNGQEIAVVQIAGLVARRIRCDLKESQEVRKGARFGIIRFGSRLDVYLPADAKIAVAKGERVKAGETVLATLREIEMAPEKLTARQRMAERIEDLTAARQRMVERFEDLSIAKLVPSILTLLGLFSGATAIRFALTDDWRHAVVAIIAAMVFDMLDGRAARAFGADTRFGAQLDSLVDLVSFGVAPGVVVFMWSLKGMGEAGWIATLIFCACSAIRLARFNIQSASARDEGATQHNPYFTGLPMPAAAYLAVMPMLLSFQLGDRYVRDPAVASAVIILASALMVSRLPTPSIKYMHMPGRLRVAAFMAFCAFVALLINWPWATLTGGFALYAVGILVTLFRHVQDEDEEPVPAEDLIPPCGGVN